MSTVLQRFEVDAERLRHRLDPSTLPFETTADVEPLQGTIGQPRALDALEFGLDIHTHGYNLFVVGAPGSGRLSTVREHLETLARQRPVPGDWVYVHDVRRPERPVAIGLPAGRGRELARDMDEFVTAARREIGRAFESDEYQRRQSEVLAETERQQQAIRKDLEAFAAERGFGLQLTPVGVAVFPLSHGKPLSTDEVEKLPEEERHTLAEHSEEIHERFQTDARQIRQLEREGAQRVADLDRAVALAAIGPVLAVLRDKYADQAAVLEHLAAVEADVPEHLAEFRGQTGGGEKTSLAELIVGAGAEAEDHQSRYRVNVVVDNGDLESAPVVIERNPTYYNLVGRIEYRARFGAMVTEFTQIRAGALHRANGGFLVLEALDVLVQPFAWEALKRALRAHEVPIENLSEQLSFVPTATLRPQSIPLDVKVVLIGTPLLHRLLFSRDEDFGELFKVKVDFAPEMEWDEENVRYYAAFINRCVMSNGARHLDRGAVARVVEQGARLRGDQHKLSTRLLDISDLVTEAAFWAEKAGHDVVTADDVEKAVRRKEQRSAYVEERVRELIRKGTIKVDVDGARVGEVNGLSVVDLGDHTFGQPSRVSATVALGRGTVESIEREIDLSGPIHSKGVLILSGYLAQTYAQSAPLSLRATLTFEQSYGEVEGDSASTTELYALLSALSGLPIDQSVAVTGSVNQHGEVQAVGGVTHKVEGFYRVCQERGLTGRQGVLLPTANVDDLMLDEAVVDSVRRGEFHVWAVSTVDEGIELLTGHPAGERGEDGSYPEGTVHRLVADRLAGYTERIKALGATPESAAERNGHAPAAAAVVEPGGPGPAD